MQADEDEALKDQLEATERTRLRRFPVRGNSTAVQSTVFLIRHQSDTLGLATTTTLQYCLWFFGEPANMFISTAPPKIEC